MNGRPFSQNPHKKGKQPPAFKFLGGSDLSLALRYDEEKFESDI